MRVEMRGMGGSGGALRDSEGACPGRNRMFPVEQTHCSDGKTAVEPHDGSPRFHLLESVISGFFAHLLPCLPQLFSG